MVNKSATQSHGVNTTSSMPDQDAADSLPVAAIAGGVAGFVIVVAIVILIVCLCRRRKRARNDDMVRDVKVYERGESKTEDNYGFDNKSDIRFLKTNDKSQKPTHQLELTQRNGHVTESVSAVSTVYAGELPYPLHPPDVQVAIPLGTGDDFNSLPQETKIGFESILPAVEGELHTQDIKNRNGSLNDISDVPQNVSHERRWSSLDGPRQAGSSLFTVNSYHPSPIGFHLLQMTTDAVDGQYKCLSSNEIENGQWGTPLLNPYYFKSAHSTASSLGRDSGLGVSQDALSHTDVSSMGSGCAYSEGDITPDSIPDSEIILPHQASKLTSDCPANTPKRNIVGPSKALINRKRPRPIHESNSEDDSSELKSPNLSADPKDFDPRADIARLLRMFKLWSYESHTDDDVIGGCTKNFAAAFFSNDGGLLRFSDGSASVNIPPDALTHTQLISVYAYYETYSEHGRTYLRRVIECGPEGIEFMKPVCVSFKPQLIDCTDRERKFAELDVLTSNNRNDDEWAPLLEKETFWEVLPDPQLVTIHVMHFTRFTIAPKAFIQPTKMTALYTGPTCAGAVGGAEEKTIFTPVSMYALQKEHGLNATFVKIFIADDSEGFVNHTKELEGCNEAFFSVLRVPRSMKVVMLSESDLQVEVINCYLCEVIGERKHEISDLTQMPGEELESICEFRVANTKDGVDGSFDVAVFQQHKKGPIRTISLCVNNTNFIENFRRTSSVNDNLEYTDILVFLSDMKILPYKFNSLLPKDVKLTACMYIDDWLTLAEYIGVAPEKNNLLKSYTKERHETPCYVLMDLLEARYVSQNMNCNAAAEALVHCLEKLGYERAADKVGEKVRELNRKENKPLHKQHVSSTHDQHVRIAPQDQVIEPSVQDVSVKRINKGPITTGINETTDNNNAAVNSDDRGAHRSDLTRRQLPRKSVQNQMVTLVGSSAQSLQYIQTTDFDRGKYHHQQQQPDFRHETFGSQDPPNDANFHHSNLPLSHGRSKNDSGIESDTESQATSTVSNSSDHVFNSVEV